MSDLLDFNALFLQAAHALCLSPDERCLIEGIQAGVAEGPGGQWHLRMMGHCPDCGLPVASGPVTSREQWEELKARFEVNSFHRLHCGGRTGKD